MEVKRHAATKTKQTDLMTHSAQAILTDIYDAWRAQSLDWLATYLPDDFYIPLEMHPLGGTTNGNNAAIERLGLIFQQFDTQKLETGQITAEPSGATIEVRTRCRHRPSGVWLETTKSNIWTLEDGWPVRLDEHYDLSRFQAFMKSAQDRLSPNA